MSQHDRQNVAGKMLGEKWFE